MALADAGIPAKSMSVDPSLYLLVGLIALAPGAVAWFFSRRLIHRLSDPALPELLAGHRRRNGIMFVIGVTGCAWLSVLTSDHVALTAIGGALLTYAGLIAAAYPLRRVLYGETWSFLSYCFFYPRSIAAVFGFWIAVAALPDVAACAGHADWIASLVIGGVLVLWNIRYADVARWCLHAQPLPEGDLLSACRALAEKCGLPRMRFDRVVLNGGVIANALALPSLRSSSVVFTETVLERFERPEILAICAHELAHFDHYNTAYLRRLRIRNILLIAVGVIVPPLARLAGVEWGLLPNAAWLLTIVGSLAVRAKGKQQQETMCDLKAVQLTGDPEALVRGLTKLYTIARLPRRVPNQTEQSATHPSLARRIRDIRKAAGSAPVPLSSTHSFTSTDGRATVAFQDEGVRWVDADGVTYTVSYAHLTELRVEAKPGRAPHLVAVGPSARRWELSLCESDVAPVQSVLDTVDGRLADPPPRKVTLAPRLHRLVMLTMVTMALSVSQLGMALVALLAWAKPTMPLLVGAGFAAMTAAALVLRDFGPGSLGEMWWFLAILGLVFFALAWTMRRAPRGGARPFIAVLAVAAACSLGLMLMHGTDAVDLHRGAREISSATVLLVALSGTLLCSPGRRMRVAAAAVASSALAIAAIASTPFLDRFGNDPFLVGRTPLRWTTLDTSPVGRFSVPPGTSRIRLSPSGRYVAAYGRNYDRSSSVQVGRVGASLTSISADDVAFVNDENLLVVSSDSHSTTLRAERLEEPREVMWQRVLENVSAPALSVDRLTGRWGIVGWNGDDLIVRVEGGLDGSTVEEKQWPVAQDRDGYIAAMTTAGQNALVLETRYEGNAMARPVPRQWTWTQLLLPPRAISRYATLTEHGRQASAESKLDVRCAADVVRDGVLACTAYDGNRTHIVTIGTNESRATGVGFLDDRFLSDESTVRGWLTGWVGGRPIAIHLPAGEVFCVSPASRTLRLLPLADDRIAALTYANNQFEVVVYAPLSGPGSVTRVAQSQQRPVRP